MTDALPRKRSKRKTSRRSKTGQKKPYLSERNRRQWADPEWRARWMAKKPWANANKVSRSGVPDGMRKAEADLRWEAARAKAKELHKIMSDEGEVVPLDLDTMNIPETDEGKSSLALYVAMVEMIAPTGRKQDRISAARLILDFCKKKPATTADVNLNSAEAWLEKVVKDNVTDGDRGATPPSP